MNVKIPWPPTRDEWDAWVRSEEMAKFDPVAFLNSLVDRYQRTRRLFTDDACLDLSESTQSVFALGLATERSAPGLLDAILRLVSAPSELTAEAFGDVLSESWEPLILTLCRDESDLGKLTSVALNSGADVLGRSDAIIGIASLTRRANDHSLAHAAASTLDTLVDTLGAKASAPDASGDDAEAFSHALSHALVCLAPHAAARKACYLEWYDHSRAVHRGILGSREYFLADLEAATPREWPLQKWPFRFTEMIHELFGSDADIRADRVRVHTQQAALVEKELVRIRARKGKRKAQKAARKKSKSR